MSLGKPIISTLPISNEPSVPYLAKYPDHFFVDELNVSVEENARNLLRFITDERSIIDYDELERTFYMNTPKAVLDLLEQKWGCCNRSN